MSSKKAKSALMLIADPFLQDGYFTRAVILMTSFKEEETTGFILNKPSNVFVHEVFEDFPEFASLIYIGGPVESSLLFFIHTLGDVIPNSTPISDGLFFGGDFEKLQDLIREQKIKPKDIRFFLGYSGWAENQLQEEIKGNSWIKGNFKLPYLFTIKNRLIWPTALKIYKPKYGFYGKYAYTPSQN